ncbi:uncharacterized protein ARMOST_11398 [Armillaria ostoyae]|uniref:Uncharacterized protein n=1 Tax=Armillaria ostoyae TaxID=47428 RepID=A0A284RH11_ARMOS|nr:uncharacterized protein ARMOST_11398 [Armillaria ostoyae]
MTSTTICNDCPSTHDDKPHPHPDCAIPPTLTSESITHGVGYRKDNNNSDDPQDDGSGGSGTGRESPRMNEWCGREQDRTLGLKGGGWDGPWGKNAATETSP